MKRIFFASCLVAGLVSCDKKNETPADTLPVAPISIPPDTVMNEHPDHPGHDLHTTETTPLESKVQDNLSDQGQKIPLTSVALTEPSFNFGNIKKGEQKNHTFEITNTGKNPLIISEVRPTCGCTAPEFSKEPISPGQKAKVVLNFDSTNFEGPVTKTAEVYANTEKSPIILSFQANIQ